jgi:hypothetical protein
MLSFSFLPDVRESKRPRWAAEVEGTLQLRDVVARAAAGRPSSSSRRRTTTALEREALQKRCGFLSNLASYEIRRFAKTGSG